MTARSDRFRSIVADGGALGAAAFDIATRAVVVGHGLTPLVPPGLLDLLLGTVRPSGSLTRACGGAPPSTARELFVAGTERATYCAVLPHGEVIVLVTPAAMSIALGWSLLRGLANGWNEP